MYTSGEECICSAAINALSHHHPWGFTGGIDTKYCPAISGIWQRHRQADKLNMSNLYVVTGCLICEAALYGGFDMLISSCPTVYIAISIWHQGVSNAHCMYSPIYNPKEGGGEYIDKSINRLAIL